MKRNGLSIEECRIHLINYLAEIEELTTLIENPNSLTRSEIKKARDQLKNFKEHLKNDHKLQEQEKMSKVEAAIFEPAVHQAIADLHISSASRPSQEWLYQLYNTQITLRYALADLDKWDSDSKL